MHPSGSRSFVRRSIPPARKSRGTEISNHCRNSLCSFEPETPVRYCGPQKSSVPSRVQKGSTSMVGRQHSMAYDVVSKDEEIGSMSGVSAIGT